MASIKEKIKPVSGFSHFVHIGLVSLLPALVFVLVRVRFAQIAVAIILLGKWRMFAVKPRHWPANIRANAVDIIVSLSFIIFMTHSGSQLMQLLWAVLYGVWLLVLKPQSNELGVSLQAIIGQTVGLIALFLNWGDASVLLLIVLTWLVCYSAARHFFTSFEETHGRFLSYMWGYFAAATVWVLSHWLLFYSVISQPTLLLTVIGLTLGSIYFLEQTDRLSIVLRRQLIFVLMAVIIIVLTFSDWGDKAI